MALLDVVCLDGIPMWRKTTTTKPQEQPLKAFLMNSSFNPNYDARCRKRLNTREVGSNCKFTANEYWSCLCLATHGHRWSFYIIIVKRRVSFAKTVLPEDRSVIDLPRQQKGWRDLHGNHATELWGLENGICWKRSTRRQWTGTRRSSLGDGWPSPSESSPTQAVDHFNVEKKTLNSQITNLRKNETCWSQLGWFHHFRSWFCAACCSTVFWLWASQSSVYFPPMQSVKVWQKIHCKEKKEKKKSFLSIIYRVYVV